MRRALATGCAAGALLLPAALAPAQEQPPTATLDELVVTATRRPEPRSSIAGTVQVVDEETIRRSTAQNLTDLLAERGVGFFSEWTPAQTSINIRGGATDGQGRDFRSQVLVLVNGRRAGTANLSKLSPADLERIEIVRGPASVVYGSQAIGGVVNLILRDGRSSPGGFVGGAAGSWGLVEGRARYGGTLPGFDYYLGLSGGRRDDYRVGGGTREINTGWTRKGITGALGADLGAAGRLGLTLRSDGVYDAGFRGSSWSLGNRDDRSNASADLFLDGATGDGRFRWNLQGYLVRDEDEFRWLSPVVRNAAGLPAPGTSRDFNFRRLDIAGARLQPVVRLWAGAEALVGLDVERSWLRSTRDRVNLPGGGTGQVAPQDNNQTDSNLGLYAELSQRLFDERLTLRAGVRQTWGTTSFDPTPNLPLQRNRDAGYDATTWSAGAAFRAAERLVVRANASTGFRAPTATELAADFTALGGGRVFGNPNLKPETNEQYEVGAAWFGAGWRTDLALFQNTIEDRIVTQARPGAANTSDWANNPGAVRVRGLELQLEADAGRWLGWGGWRWHAFANGSWNFDMIDEGKRLGPTVNTRTAERMYRYQAALGSTVGQAWWDVTLLGVLRGPMYYNTEENLLVPRGEPFREFVHRKGAFWVWNLRGSVAPLPDLVPGLRAFGAINNIFDENYHPIFIATESLPYISDPRFSNGGRGNSAPGREYIAGLRFAF